MKLLTRKVIVVALNGVFLLIALVLWQNSEHGLLPTLLAVPPVVGLMAFGFRTFR